ncbi:response regulator [Sediminibacterium soli]|uniref:response regulator n=1 Tax=Sediminibacterium soli TaxID=2698829 RepID=UPI001379693B|nr:response regulator [Sediminibacterium soli]NCI46646.1 response regulator [Sediminibacterium soli]
MADRKKILIVDDDARNIFALAAVLRSRGYDCLSATGMKDAFAILRQETGIRAILLDMMMPDMDGYQGLPHLKQQERSASIPVIAVTAQAMAGDREKCLRAGADGYLSKPVNIDELLPLLATHIK